MTAPFRSPTDADLADELAALRATAPATLRPSTLVALGLADAYAAIDSPIGPLFVAFNGLGVSAVEQAPDGATFETVHVARTGRPAHADAALPARLAAAIDAGSAVIVGCGSSSTCAVNRVRARGLEQGARDPAGRGPTVWLDRGRDRRPKAVRAVGTALGHNPVPLIVPCHRVVRSDGTIGQYSLGGPATSGRSSPARASTRTSSRRLARAGVRYIGSDTTRIYCLPTCHNAQRIAPAHRVAFRSAGEAASAGYRACLPVPPGRGGARRRPEPTASRRLSAGSAPDLALCCYLDQSD